MAVNNKVVEGRKSAAYYLTLPVVRLLAKMRVTPDAITWFGLLVTAGAAALIATGRPFIGGFVLLLAGFFDILDGALARSTNQATKFGAVLDSTLDRVAESIVLLGLIILYARAGFVPGVILASVALPSSLMVSYVRARAEGIGLECQEGLFTRAERVVVLALGLLLSQIKYALIIALSVLVVFSLITVVQRLVYVWRRTKIR